MSYMKLQCGNGRKHLVYVGRNAFDPAEGAATTLCGCTVTRAGSWTRISCLEGDECPRCADRTFWASIDHDSPVPAVAS